MYIEISYGKVKVLGKKGRVLKEIVKENHSDLIDYFQHEITKSESNNLDLLINLRTLVITRGDMIYKRAVKKDLLARKKNMKFMDNLIKVGRNKNLVIKMRVR